jgi:tuftelin-interacting protein 11
MLEIYVKILPTWLYQEIVEHLLLPKLNRMLEEWNVKRGWDIHTWIFPWLPLIGQELEELWAPCRRILQQSLKKWTPAEDLGLDIVGKWSEVFKYSFRFLMKMK